MRQAARAHPPRSGQGTAENEGWLQHCAAAGFCSSRENEEGVARAKAANKAHSFGLNDILACSLQKRTARIRTCKGGSHALPPSSHHLFPPPPSSISSLVRSHHSRSTVLPPLVAAGTSRAGGSICAQSCHNTGDCTDDEPGSASKPSFSPTSAQRNTSPLFFAYTSLKPLPHTRTLTRKERKHLYDSPTWLRRHPITHRAVLRSLTVVEENCCCLWHLQQRPQIQRTL